MDADAVQFVTSVMLKTLAHENDIQSRLKYGTTAVSDRRMYEEAIAIVHEANVKLVNLVAGRMKP